MHNLGVSKPEKEKIFFKSGLAMSQTEDNGKVDNPATFNKVLFQARLCDDKKRSSQIALGADKMCHIPLLWH